MIEEILSPEFVMISLPPMLVGLLASLACALPGNFLLLRRQALIGDAISHVALPGIVLFWWMMRTGLVDQAMGTAGKEDGAEEREVFD